MVEEDIVIQNRLSEYSAMRRHSQDSGVTDAVEQRHDHSNNVRTRGRALHMSHGCLVTLP